MTPDPTTPDRDRSALLRRVVPFLVSGALLAYVFSKIDIRLALDYLTLDIVLGFLGPLILFNLVTLAIEARCLHRVAATQEITLGHLTAARIKAACYLLSILNYALGAAGLSLLLARRTRRDIAPVVSMVFLISLLDVGSVLLLAAIGASFQEVAREVASVELRFSVVVGLIAAIFAGFAFLRAPFSMGPLEVVRSLAVFRAPREAPIGLLVELMCWRALFVGSYVALTSALFHAFGIEVEWARLATNVAIILAVSALPIAAGGLGTGQIVFVAIFAGVAPDAQLLSASILLSIGLVVTRAMTGFAFAFEFTREALEAARDESHEARLRTAATAIDRTAP